MRKRGLAVFVWLSVLVLPAAAAEALAGWSYCAEILTNGEQRYKSLILPEEIYAQAAPDLRDLRICDAQGEPVPYYIQSGRQLLRSRKISYATEIVQRFTKNNDSYLELRVLPQQAQSDAAGNSLTFELPPLNFLKKLDVYGGYDGEKWEYIGKGELFRTDGHSKAELDLGGRKKYGYYRIVVLDNAENIALGAATINDAYTENRWERFIRNGELSFALTHAGHESVLTIDNPKQLPLKQLQIEADGNFQRQYKLIDAASGAVICSGELYQLQFATAAARARSIDLADKPQTATKLLLKIDNRDDRPLAVGAVRAEYYSDKLVFEATGRGPYRIWFGNPQATAPNYELALQKKYIEQEPQEECRLGAIDEQAQPAAQTEPFFNRKRLFSGAIAFVSLLLIATIAAHLKNK